MKPRLRPIKNLYHRWGVHLGLDALQVAEALMARSLIDVDGESYRETNSERLPLDEYEALIFDVLTEWKANNE